MGWGDGNGSLVSVYLLIMPLLLFKNIFIVNYQYFSVPSPVPYTQLKLDGGYDERFYCNGHELLASQESTGVIFQFQLTIRVP